MSRRDQAPGGGTGSRGRSQFPGAPRWIWTVALGLTGLFVGFVVVPMSAIRSSSQEMCARCPAVRRVEIVLGLPFARRPEPTPGRAVFERVVGACAEHVWKELQDIQRCGNCPPSFDLTAIEIFDHCAGANASAVPEVVRRLARLSIPQRTDLFWQVVTSPNFDPGSGDPRRWVTAIIATQGWSDLERR